MPIIVDRLRSDLRLALLALFSVLSSTAILPFAVYRALQGQWLIAAFDLLIVMLVTGSFTYAWRTGRSAAAGIVGVAVISAAVIVIPALAGLVGLLWVYTTLIANFMLARIRLAAIANAMVIAGTLLHSGLFPSKSMAVAFIATALLVSFYSSLFSWLTENQRGQLEALASRDPLTGVGNRRALEQELQAAMALHNSAGQPIGLAVFDLDHFKQVNDEHGHDAGDRVLVAFADLVQGCIRKRDRVFRIGGEEFVLLLPGTDTGGLEQALAKVLARVRSNLRGPGGAVTVSIGATLLKPGDDWTTWLARADAALYFAKRNGRDRICTDDQAAADVDRRVPAVVSPA
ncbi:diguanylate cyclase domain-containing protein [Alkalisalibacterium limincola]|nr:diguanylate cyclase [Alkalisalibacterium limincola]